MALKLQPLLTEADLTRIKQTLDELNGIEMQIEQLSACGHECDQQKAILLELKAVNQQYANYYDRERQLLAQQQAAGHTA